jgi:uncharacterized SAM-binding protein YcdF (DUF218 family)
MRVLRRALIVAFAVAVLIAVYAVFAYRSIPLANTNATHFDAIIVLGYPANADGSPSPEQRERTLEGVREFKAGVAPKLIFTGAAAHNQFVEAHVMTALAEAQGVPMTSILEEGQAQNTIQNIFYSQRIMAEHGWTSAEVVSSPNHLPRTSLILKYYTFQWRTQAAPWPPEYGFWERTAHYAVEVEYCLRLQILGFTRTPFLPSN